jgi:hypothetical protein
MRCRATDTGRDASQIEHRKPARANQALKHVVCEARLGHVRLQERRACRPQPDQGRDDAADATGNDRSADLVFRKSGRYPYLRTVSGHAAAGIKGIFTVRWAMKKSVLMSSLKPRFDWQVKRLLHVDLELL